MPSHGALTLFFRWRKKSVQKKASGTALQRRPAPLRVAGFGLREPFGLSSASVRFAHPPGKSPLLPILTAGLAMSRAMELDSFHQLLERARARLFPPSKWAGLFPSAAYRRSAPPQVALGRLKWRRLGCSDAAEMVSQRRKTGLFFAVGAIHTPIAPLGILQNGLDIFATKKASVVFYPR